MKREIKFRAWDKDDNRMITHQQDFIPLKVSSIGVLKLDPGVEYESWYVIQPLDRFILMQFTGLLDKNGKEIYEGDVLHILKIGSNSDRIYTGVVEWRTEQAGWIITCGKFILEILSLAMSGDGLETRLDGAEIIGNIYESPELLNPQP